MRNKKSPEIKSRGIPSSLYDRIVKNMPIPTVEALIIRNSSLLFLRRNNSPAKGQWWFPGGRIRKGESLEDTLFRSVREETGLEVIRHKLVTVYSRVFPERHDIAMVFLCECRGEVITLDSQHSEYRFFKKVPTNIHPHLKQTIRDSNWAAWQR